MSAESSTSVRSSSLAALAWVDEAGEPHATGVVALTHGTVPAVALTFARSNLARMVTGAGSSRQVGPAALALVESRGTGPGFRPVVLTAETRLVVDPTGDLHGEEMLDQELRRYPPARLLADSALLCRENWWFLPRLVVELPHPVSTDLGDPGAERRLLVTVDGATPRVTRVSAVEPGTSPDRLELRVVAGPPPVPGPGLLFDQDASFPDLERWVEWSWRGTVAGAGPYLRLDVDVAPERIGLPPPTPLLERWRRHRRLERACRRGLARWEAGENS